MVNFHFPKFIWDNEMIVIKQSFFNYLVWRNWHLGSCVPSLLILTIWYGLGDFVANLSSWTFAFGSRPL